MVKPISNLHIELCFVNSTIDIEGSFTFFLQPLLPLASVPFNRHLQILKVTGSISRIQPAILCPCLKNSKLQVLGNFYEHHFCSIIDQASNIRRKMKNVLPGSYRINDVEATLHAVDSRYFTTPFHSLDMLNWCEQFQISNRPTAERGSSSSHRNLAPLQRGSIFARKQAGSHFSSHEMRRPTKTSSSLPKWIQSG